MFSFELPKSLISTQPAEHRDESKLLVWDLSSDTLTHTRFKTFPDYFNPTDLLVLNNTQVIKARLYWMWKGKQQEIFILKMIKESATSTVAQVLISGKKIPMNEPLPLQNIFFKLSKRQEGSLACVEFLCDVKTLQTLIETHGQTPLPPYILKERIERKESFAEDEKRYQTLYAQAKGAVAAPTAGLHFSQDVLDRLETKGVNKQFLTLHVGWGTFQPFTPEQWETRTLHAEQVLIPKETLHAVQAARARGSEVLAVGTTTTRALEWAFLQNNEDTPVANGITGECNLMIRPKFNFQAITRLLTNFHLPESSLLALVSAFVEFKGIQNGAQALKKVYQEAIDRQYHFYSYGDAMLIL